MGDAYSYLKDTALCGVCGDRFATSQLEVEVYTDAAGDSDWYYRCYRCRMKDRFTENLLGPKPQHKAAERQEGGDHYKKRKIQPIDYILANKLSFCEGNVVKYVTRWRDKGGLEDLKKARHYLDFLIEQAEQEQEGHSHP